MDQSPDMMIAALAALGAGALAGIFLATRHFLRKRLPATVALLHGLGGATGFGIVLFVVVREPAYRPIRDVLYLLIATVLLGVVNLLFHIRRVRHRTSLILMHGLTAVTSAAMLIRAIVIYAPPAEAARAPGPSEPAVAVAAAPAAGTLAAAGAPAAPAPAAAEPTAPEQPKLAEPAADEFRVEPALRQALARSIGFETNSATVSSGSRADIAELAEVIEAHPEIGLIEVQGHADERGDDGRNVELTRSRAAAVVSALVARGVARERLHSAGYGARCPAEPACQRAEAPESCHAADAWQRDRRVVFAVLQIGKAEFRGEVACARGADLIPEQDRRFHAPDAAQPEPR